VNVVVANKVRLAAANYQYENTTPEITRNVAGWCSVRYRVQCHIANM